MDYIEIMITEENKLVCKYVGDSKEIIIENKNIIKILNVLKENGVIPKRELIDGIETLRYYNISKFYKGQFCEKNIHEVVSKRAGNTKKVRRIKKYAPAVAVTSSILTLVLMLNHGKKEPEKVTEVPKETAIILEETFNRRNSIWENVASEFGIERVVVEEIKIDKNFDFVYEDQSQSVKALNVKENYYDVIEKKSNTYGLPVNLMLAVASVESGGDSDVMSGDGALGLFQIQIKGDWNWVGKKLTAYNFELGEYETIIVCMNENGVLDTNLLKNPEYNTKVACMLMANNLQTCDYDIICALQAYNAGWTPVQLRRNYGDNWINYRKECVANYIYVEEVLSYINSSDNIFKYMDTDCNTYNVSVTNVKKSARKKVLTLS